MMTPKRSIKGAEINRTSNPSVMKYIGTIIILLALVLMLGKPKPEVDKNPIVHITETVHTQSATPEPTQKPPEQPKQPEPTPTPKVVEKPVVKPQTPPPAPAGTCRDAIAREWPAELQAGAIIVMTHENRSENPQAIGAVNQDGYGSQDFGCFQINNHWHANFFATNDWRDPYANARYAYQIYKGRGNWTAWYAVKEILW